MDKNSKIESNRQKEDAQQSRGTSGIRQNQGFITLSPARKMKDRTKS